MDRVHILYPERVGTISPEIYGHFSEHIGGVIYGGIWVGENSKIPNVNGFRKALAEKFSELRPPVLRWPGGCFAETYDWRDGIGVPEKRPKTVNWWYHNDGRLESNRFGTHEFIAFCRLVGAKPYFAANSTSLTPLQIRNWMEYCNFPSGTSLSEERAANGNPEPFGVPYWGLGNENWGGGGMMTPEEYCAVYRKYATVCSSVENKAEFIACGPNGGDYDWTRRFFEAFYRYSSPAGCKLDGFSMHYYCGTSGLATEFNEEQWYELLEKAARIEEILKRHRAVMDSYDPERKVSLIIDEWGCWHREGSGPSKGKNLFEQQVTMRDAAVTGLTLNIFNNHCDKVKMANAAQLVNNLHTMFLTEDDRMVVTPNYHVYRMMREHQGASCLRALAECETNGGIPRLSVSASVKDGKTAITLVNTSYSDPAETEIRLYGGSFARSVEKTTLSAAPDAYNTFENPDAVSPATEIIDACGDRLGLTLPAASVVTLSF